uniref:Radical_SAM_C domain-containing protein n=1 Tax=Globodera pallida TaxID=36090 RepID=A0A183C2C5_GLOPA
MPPTLEMHRRPRRPWIVLYMTHPYLVSNDEDKVQWFIMNDTDRFFDILKRYKVDLLTSCGIEGMARLLTKKKKEMPEAKLPEYVQTTMAQCGGYQSIPNNLESRRAKRSSDAGRLGTSKRRSLGPSDQFSLAKPPIPREPLPVMTRLCPVSPPKSLPPIELYFRLVL